ncbi:MAG: hypothetical protein F4Z59_03730, partial [Gemmatimonadales bacterium]|nr:hypothetical protein [Gemmatimonadales bacterium]
MSDYTPAGGPEPGSEAFEAELRDEIRRELETHGGGSGQPEIVKLRDVWLSFGDHEVLRGVSLGVARGGT